jgi:hypothetical protein
LDLFGEVTRQLASKGLILKRGTVVDATIIESMTRSQDGMEVDSGGNVYAMGPGGKPLFMTADDQLLRSLCVDSLHVNLNQDYGNLHLGYLNDGGSNPDKSNPDPTNSVHFPVSQFSYFSIFYPSRWD